MENSGSSETVLSGLGAVIFLIALILFVGMLAITTYFLPTVDPVVVYPVCGLVSLTFYVAAILSVMRRKEDK